MAEQTPRCIVLGGINLDIQGFAGNWGGDRAEETGSSQRFLLRDPILHDSNPGRVHRTPGGVGRNIAENLARLELCPQLVTIVGTGASWRSLIRHTRALGIGLDCSISIPGAPLPVYLCILQADCGLHTAISDMRALEALTPERLEPLLPQLASADCLVVDANLPQPTIAWIAANFGRQRGSRGSSLGTELSDGMRRPLLVADTVSAAKAARMRDCLGAFDIVKPNLAEMAVLADTTMEPGGHANSASFGAPSDVPQIPAPASTLALARALADRLHALGRMPGRLFLSLGTEGMFYRSASEEGHLMLPPASLRPPIVNRSGAGDAACAAITWAHVRARAYGLTPSTERQGEARGTELDRALSPRLVAALAISAAVLTASSRRTVHRGLCPRLLCEAAAAWYPELAEHIKEFI